LAYVDSLKPVQKAPGRASRPFSISGIKGPSFHSLKESVQHALPCTLEVPPLGFGYPFDGVSSLQTSEASFSSQRSWASPFEAFLQIHDRLSCLQLVFRSGAFPTNLLSLLPALQRLHPMSSAVSLFAPEGLVQVGTLAPLGILTSWALPPTSAASKPLSLRLPSHPFKSSWLPISTPGISGSLTLADWLSPFEKGAGPSGLSHRLP
jgi:hypothetical protein